MGQRESFDASATPGAEKVEPSGVDIPLKEDDRSHLADKGADKPLWQRPDPMATEAKERVDSANKRKADSIKATIEKIGTIAELYSGTDEQALADTLSRGFLGGKKLQILLEDIKNPDLVTHFGGREGVKTWESLLQGNIHNYCKAVIEYNQKIIQENTAKGEKTDDTSENEKLQLDSNKRLLDNIFLGKITQGSVKK